MTATRKAPIKRRAPKSDVSGRVGVTEANLRKAASRLLASTLVSPEIAFIQRELGASATQDELDAKILAVRALPWSAISPPE